MLPAQTDVDSHHQYALLIHSLTHEHTLSNVERHFLLIQKWIRDNDDGIILQDLEYVSEILKIVKSFLSSNYAVFRPAVTSMLALCCKPLLETKANERLRAKGIADMKVFYKALTSFNLDANSELKIEIMHCLRCIINGGKDSLVLRTDTAATKVRKNKVPIIDTAFIQSLVRDCSIIDFIVLEFQDSVDAFEKATSDFTESTMVYTQRSVQLNSRATVKQQTLRETLREYGIPEDFKVLDECSEEEKDAPFDNENNVEDCSIEVIKTLPMLKTQKVLVTLQDRLTTDLLELCVDLAKDPKNADIMIAMRMCDGIIKFLRLLVQENVRDRRVSLLIELIWTLLDCYLNEGKNDLDKDDAQPASIRGEYDIDPRNLAHIIDQVSAVSTLGHMITIYAQDGFKLPDKEIRNEVLAVLTLLAESPSAHSLFFDTGLLNDFVYYACFAECSSMCESLPEWLDQHPQSSSNPRNFGTASEIDLQFKRGLWIIISDLLQNDDPTALACVVQSPLLLSLLYYLEFDTLPMGNQKTETPAGSPPRDKLLTGVVEVVEDGSSSFAESSRLSGVEQDKISGSMVSGDESWGPAKTETEDVIPDRFSVTKESEDAFRNCFAHTTGRNAVTDVKYVTGNIGESHSFLGSIPHLHMLQLQVLAATLLAEVGAKFVDDFVLIRGPERVLETVIHYCKSDTSDHISMVGILLIFLNRLVASSLAVRSEMETRNALQFFLLLSERSADDLSKAQAIRAIALLCASRDCQTQLREQDGIQLLVLAIKRCVEPKKPLVGLRAGFKVGDKYHIDQDDPSLTPLAGDVSVYVVSLLDCVSKAVAGNEKSESLFAAHDGLDILLELIESAPLVLRLPAMRLLSDLLDNVDLVPYVRAWRSSKTLRSAVQLATHCWLDEEVRLGGVRGGGVITNILDPLGGHNWPAPGTGLPPSAEAIPLISFSMSTASMGTETCRSLAVSRLSAAILHSRVTDDIPLGNVPLSMRHAVLESDIRGVVASVLQLLGAFDSTSILGGEKTNTNQQDDDTTATASCASTIVPLKGVESASTLAQRGRRRMNTANPLHTESVGSLRSTLNPRNSIRQERSMTVEELRVLQEDHDISLSVAEKQVVAIARRYAVLKEGGWWKDISSSLRNSGTIPIESDMSMLKGKLEDFFDTAQMVRMEQIILKDVEDMTSQTSERIFLNQIGSRKAQDTRAATSKMNSRMGSAKNTLK